MKRAMLLVLFTFALGASLKAQNGTKFATIKGGYKFSNAFSIAASYDWNAAYFKQNEVFLEYAQKTSDKEVLSVMGGFVMKPVLFREGNSIMRVRMGVGAGSNKKTFIVAPQLGFEFSQTMLSGIDLVLANRNEYVFRDKLNQRWRAGLEVGVRFPIN